MDRIEKIKNTLLQAFQNKLNAQNVNTPSDSAWDILISADPSPNKKNVRWLVETYINDGYLWEDIASGKESKVSETLVAFGKYKRNLEPSERSLNKYQTLGSLWSAIKPFVGQLTANEEKREERDKAYAEAEIIVDREDGFKIVSPLTMYSAQWFGRGTRWCTSADRDNMFHYYNDQAPLFVIIMPNGDKLQFWKDGSSIQFMDENDNRVTTDYVGQNWDTLGPLVKWMNILRFIPGEHITKDMAEYAFDEDIRNISYIPKEFITEDMRDRIADSSSGDIAYIRYIPTELLPEDVCDAIYYDHVKTYKNNVRKKDYMNKSCLLSSVFVYEQIWKYMENISIEVVHDILKHKPSVIHNIPSEYVTRGFLLNFIFHNNTDILTTIDKALINMLSQEEIMRAYHFNHNVFSIMKDEWKTYDMCIRALSSSLKMFEYIPEKWRTTDFLYKICKHSKDLSLEEIPEAYVTRELAELAIKRNPDNFMFIPDHLKTEEMCKKMLETNIRYFSAIPDEQKTEEMCMDIISKDPAYVNFIPEVLWTEEMCRYILIKNKDHGSYVQYFPHRLKTRELYELAFKNSNKVFSLMPDSFKTLQMCKTVLMNKPNGHGNWDRIPEQYQNEIIDDESFTHLDYLQFVDTRNERLKPYHYDYMVDHQWINPENIPVEKRSERMRELCQSIPEIKEKQYYSIYYRLKRLYRKKDLT